jgi:hypothetical protein
MSIRRIVTHAMLTYQLLFKTTLLGPFITNRIRTFFSIALSWRFPPLRLQTGLNGFNPSVLS